MFIKEVPEFQGKKVTVMGLGLFGGGVGITRYLVKHGAQVTVSDTKPEKDLAESIARLEGYPVTYHLGGHSEQDFADIDLVIVNPAVPPESTFLKCAQKHRIPLETEMNLFFKLCQAPILAVTGSNGKTTTAALVNDILKTTSTQVWLGGNIGKSLLEECDQIQSKDLVVLELSSFQLENLAALERSPHIAVVTNMTPNHLDRHGTMGNYIKAKRNIVQYQTPGDWAILNGDDPTVRTFEKSTQAKTIFFSIKNSLPQGVFGHDDKITLRWRDLEFHWDVSRRKIPGWFNLQNMTAAVAATFLATETIQEDRKIWRQTLGQSLVTFPGVEHRLEFVGEQKGIKYYNDSIATNPESTMAALDALNLPIILIAGGYDKKLPFDKLGEKMATRVKHLLLLGQTAPQIADCVRTRSQEIRIDFVPNLEAAVQKAKTLGVAGDTVLLSPACASYDMFRNFAERGTLFKQFVIRS